MVKKVLSTKIVILGAPAVGKTTLRINLTGVSLAKDYMMTLGAEIGETVIETEEVTFNAQIFDIAGQENFLPVTRGMIQGSQGAVIVFDLTRAYTFNEVKKWLEILHEENPALSHNIPFIIVGNKEDLTGFIDADDDEVNAFLDYLNRHNVYSKADAEYIRTSAKTGHRVREAFTRLAQIMVTNFKMGGTIQDENGDIIKESEPEEDKEEFLSVTEMLRRRKESAARKENEMVAEKVSAIIDSSETNTSAEIYSFNPTPSQTNLTMGSRQENEKITSISKEQQEQEVPGNITETSSEAQTPEQAVELNTSLSVEEVKGSTPKTSETIEINNEDNEIYPESTTDGQVTHDEQIQLDNVENEPSTIIDTTTTYGKEKSIDSVPTTKAKLSFDINHEESEVEEVIEVDDSNQTDEEIVSRNNHVIDQSENKIKTGDEIPATGIKQTESNSNEIDIDGIIPDYVQNKEDDIDIHQDDDLPLASSAKIREKKV